MARRETPSSPPPSSASPTLSHVDCPTEKSPPGSLFRCVRSKASWQPRIGKSVSARARRSSGCSPSKRPHRVSPATFLAVASALPGAERCRRWAMVGRQGRGPRRAKMDEDQARTLLHAERLEVQRALERAAAAGQQDRDSGHETGDETDPGRALADEAVDDAAATSLRD